MLVRREGCSRTVSAGVGTESRPMMEGVTSSSQRRGTSKLDENSGRTSSLAIGPRGQPSEIGFVEQRQARVQFAVGDGTPIVVR